MFVIFYDKKTKEINGFRHDMAINPMTAEFAFEDYCNGHNIDKLTMNFVEMSYQNWNFINGKYLYNPVNNEIELNPSFVPPPDAPNPISITE